jgi:hypothetical protein
MATRVVYICDMCGDESARSYDGSIDGRPFTAELCAQCLERILGPASPSDHDPVDPGSLDPRAIRSWAEKNGVEVSPKGRIPGDVLMAYRKAHR